MKKVSVISLYVFYAVSCWAETDFSIDTLEVSFPETRWESEEFADQYYFGDDDFLFSEESEENQSFYTPSHDQELFFSLEEKPEETQNTVRKALTSQIPHDTSTPQKKSEEKRIDSGKLGSPIQAPQPSPQTLPIDSEPEETVTLPPKEEIIGATPFPLKEPKAAPLPSALLQPEERSPGVFSEFDTEEIAQTEDLPTFDPSSPSFSPQTELKMPEEEGFELVGGRGGDRNILVNFKNVNVIEVINFVSRMAGRNFIFDEEGLNFSLSIVADEPASINEILTMLMHELRIHGFYMIQEGENIIIHNSQDIRGIPAIIAEGAPAPDPQEESLVTRVFELNTLTPSSASTILTQLLSNRAVVQSLSETNQLIVTDIKASVDKVDTLLKSIDSPVSGLVIGQYTVQNMVVDTLTTLAQQIVTPLAQGQTILFVPHNAVNSILIVSTPYLVKRSISILRFLDENPGMTSVEDAKLSQEIERERAEAERVRRAAGTEARAPAVLPLPWKRGEQGQLIFTLPSQAGQPQSSTIPPSGKWIIRPDGSWYFEASEEPLEGRWIIRPDSGWIFEPSNPSQIEGEDYPKGVWRFGTNNEWEFELDPDEPFQPRRLARPQEAADRFALGSLEQTKFLVYKVKNRTGDVLQQAIQKIATSMQISGAVHGELTTAINSMQWMEDPNSLVFTGTESALRKVRELIEEVDTPVRQVYLDMLILETDITDSLAYSVNWGSEFGGEDSAGSTSFLNGDNGAATSSALATLVPGSTPDASGFRGVGFNLGVIGRTLSKSGVEFNSLGMLVSALHDKTRDNVLLNPKIIVEDREQATIFVGENRAFTSQNVVNEGGGFVTENVEFRDVGTTLTITPRINENNVINLVINESSSRVLPGQEGSQTATTSQSNTTTIVNVPDKYFLILSGMIQNEVQITRRQVPCLGYIPIIGAAFSDRGQRDAKKNLMIFIRPQIIETPDEIQNLTGRQQDVFLHLDRTKTRENYEVDGALDWLNLERGDASVDKGYFELN